jgi:hypothetical protein
MNFGSKVYRLVWHEEKCCDMNHLLSATNTNVTFDTVLCDPRLQEDVGRQLNVKGLLLLGGPRRSRHFMEGKTFASAGNRTPTFRLSTLVSYLPYSSRAHVLDKFATSLQWVLNIILTIREWFGEISLSLKDSYCGLLGFDTVQPGIWLPAFRSNPLPSFLVRTSTVLFIQDLYARGISVNRLIVCGVHWTFDSYTSLFVATSVLRSVLSPTWSCIGASVTCLRMEGALLQFLLQSAFMTTSGLIRV